MSLKAVRENRAIIAEYLGVEPERISCGNQVHGLKSCRNQRRSRWCWSLWRGYSYR